jgi:hypothetical protein
MMVAYQGLENSGSMKGGVEGSMLEAGFHDIPAEMKMVRYIK